MREDEVDVSPQADEATQDPQAEDAKVESVQDVTDRVRSYHEGAPVETVRGELQSALGKAELSLPDDEVQRIAQGISDGAIVDVEGSH
jgi:hypothetical protein